MYVLPTTIKLRVNNVLIIKQNAAAENKGGGTLDITL